MKAQDRELLSFTHLGVATRKAIANLRNTFWLTEGAIDSLLLDTANGSEEILKHFWLI